MLGFIFNKPRQDVSKLASKDEFITWIQHYHSSVRIVFNIMLYSKQYIERLHYNIAHIPSKPIWHSVILHDFQSRWRHWTAYDMICPEMSRHIQSWQLRITITGFYLQCNCQWLRYVDVSYWLGWNSIKGDHNLVIWPHSWKTIRKKPVFY